MRNLNLILYTICMFQLVNNTTGEDDEQCKIDFCACCIGKSCGSGSRDPNECFYGCIDGHTGANCHTLCSHNCTKCPDHEDTCTACYDGYYPGSARDCKSKCLPGCKTCTSGTTCTSCKEGYYNDDGQNDCRNHYCSENCNCENNQCVSCKDGYYDTSKRCYSICPGNCATCLSNTDCGSCADGYYKGYQNDNINFPLLYDCTYKCRDNCMRCLSYDRCSLCKTGLYGPNCENRCSVGCMSNTCDKLSGNCDCFPNFTGVRCDKCKSGKYGKMCDQQCPTWCKGSVCKKESGDCTDGCKIDTIIGDKCDVCSTGWYGQYCNISCSFGCKNQQCETKNGECSNGCIESFKGERCYQCLPDSRPSEQSTVLLLGTILALSEAINIILVVTLILRKCRKRANCNSKANGPDYENSGIELERGNAGNVSNHSIVQASNSDTVFNSHDYEDLRTIRVSEHEY